MRVDLGVEVAVGVVPLVAGVGREGREVRRRLALEDRLLLHRLGLDHDLVVEVLGRPVTGVEVVGARRTIRVGRGDGQAAEGLRLDYITPVLGPPWSIPFEFPLYQWLAGGFHALTGYPLDQSGRLVSLVFFYLCLVPWFLLFRRLAGCTDGAGPCKRELLRGLRRVLMHGK